MLTLDGVPYNNSLWQRKIAHGTDWPCESGKAIWKVLGTSFKKITTVSLEREDGLTISCPLNDFVSEFYEME